MFPVLLLLQVHLHLLLQAQVVVYAKAVLIYVMGVHLLVAHVDRISSASVTFLNVV